MAAVETEGLAGLREEDLAVSAALCDKRVGPDKAVGTDADGVGYGAVDRQKAVVAQRDHAGNIAAGREPAVITNRAVVANHRPAPDEHIVAKLDPGMNEDLAHDEAIVAMDAVPGKPGVRMHIGWELVTERAGLGALAGAEPVQVLIAQCHEHVMGFGGVRAGNLVERHCGKPVPVALRQKAPVCCAGNHFAVAVVPEKIEQDFGDFSRGIYY